MGKHIIALCKQKIFASCLLPSPKTARHREARLVWARYKRLSDGLDIHVHCLRDGAQAFWPSWLGEARSRAGRGLQLCILASRPAKGSVLRITDLVIWRQDG